MIIHVLPGLPAFASAIYMFSSCIPTTCGMSPASAWVLGPAGSAGCRMGISRCFFRNGMQGEVVYPMLRQEGIKKSSFATKIPKSKSSWVTSQRLWTHHIPTSTCISLVCPDLMGETKPKLCTWIFRISPIFPGEVPTKKNTSTHTMSLFCIRNRHQSPWKIQ